MSDRRVLPPGEFNGIMLEPLPVYSGSSATTAVTVFAVMLLTDKHVVTNKATNMGDSPVYVALFVTMFVC